MYGGKKIGEKVVVFWKCFVFCYWCGEYVCVVGFGELYDCILCVSVIDCGFNYECWLLCCVE